MNRVPNIRWPPRLLTVMPAFVSARSQQLQSLELRHWCGEDVEDIFTESPPACATQAMTAAVLSCSLLRRLRLADWWLSRSVRAAVTPALPHFESLEMVVEKGVDEATLAVLLDQAPYLEELVFNSYTGLQLPYDVLAWAGERCHRLKTLMLTADVDESVSCPAVMTEERFRRHQLHLRPAQLPLLVTLRFSDLPVPSDPLGRSLLFALIADYIVHNAPALRFLSLPGFDWLQNDRGSCWRRRCDRSAS